MLTCANLVMRFGGVHAIDGVDFELSAGHVHCVIGPNGAGKSTLFKMLTGQLRPSAGSIRLRGIDITGRSTNAIVNLGIGVKMQTPQLFETETARDNIWLGANRRFAPREAVERTAALVEELALGAHADKVVGTLAHGIRQRVEVAGVLASEPELVLLDEPAAGMSDADVADLAELILRRRGRQSFLVVEHDITFVRSIADLVPCSIKVASSSKAIATRFCSTKWSRTSTLGRG
ncbi:MULTISPECIES: ATP-binding cassette domain-containing protein [unclassified Bradyrhizobium]|uniref:ABC transporter ATP-binding protein n=1 Tax=unclassified Bradyrhizobium TaxID=2631580 RepID=UPI00247AEEEE|nr:MULTISPECIES: ATP-binding cassette domain-containing protein [unclassified Bradyrhizobium]WGS18568.1 ATP-binding cassette domain-containing protein [Bradyrhizobium sp. ISRA463]WGS25391.1 ATP-binding cassette domain-containing protein [Bradyrhizobium sp. ISRA464]